MADSDVGTPTTHSWRMAEQYYRHGDDEVRTKPNDDGYVMLLQLGSESRRVFFDPAGRITHIRPI